MQKRVGMTRRTILVGDAAVKVARFGVLRTLTVLYRGMRKPSWARERVRARSQNATRAIFLSMLELFFGGVFANRREYALYRDHPELPIARVRGMYLFGIVLVMDRGSDVGEIESAAFRTTFSNFADLGIPQHTCRIRGQLAIIDYGHPEARRAFGVA